MSNKPFFLLGEEIFPGKRKVLDLEVAKLHTRTTIKVPVIVERSKKNGPVVLLVAGIHGDEINGVGIVREIINQKINKPIKGTIICLPVFNIFGYLVHSREFPDGRDLNRVFPGTQSGSLASQFAYQFTKEIAPHVDYVIDYHTGGGDRDNIAQIRFNSSRSNIEKLAKVFNPPFLVHSNTISKSLRETINKLGKTILLFEGGKTNELNKEVINHGVRGTKNVLSYLEMIDKEQETTIEIPIFVKSSKWLRANYSGMFTVTVENGTRVKKKTVLGIIQDPFGEFKKNVYAPYDCYIFCINRTPIINKGDALFHLGLEE